MSKYSIEDSTLTAIANKLREASGQTELITPEEMPEKIAGVFEAGEKSEYDRFWDVYQELGSRVDYSYSFCKPGWTDSTFKPKYPIFGTNYQNMFWESLVSKIPIEIDFSRAKNIDYIFAASLNLIDAPPIDLSALTTETVFAVFNACTSLRSASATGLKPVHKCKSWFSYAYKLENLYIEGMLGQNGFDVHWSTLLTHDSLMCIIHALQDKSSDTGGTVWTVTLGEENLAKLTEDEIGIAEAKGWVLA